MFKLKIRKRNKERKIIWSKIRHYIDFWILCCCCIVAFNIHPNNTTDSEYSSQEKSKMIYVFHDYEWNKYILNEAIHGSANSYEYLFNDEVPDSIKKETNNQYKDSVSLKNEVDSKANNTQSWDYSSETKDNQISIENMIDDLGLSSDNEDNYLIINLSNNESNTNNEISPNGNSDLYIIKEETWSLTIEKETSQKNTTETTTENNSNNTSTDNSENIEVDSINNIELLNAKTFSFVSEWRIIPILVQRNEIPFNSTKTQNLGTVTSSNWNSDTTNSWVTIIPDYASCDTPRWYKIIHWDSVLAYKQLDNAPDICNIERRYCWNWKLSWTYTQQGCSTNENYTFESRWEIQPVSKETEIKWWARQNPDWTVTVKNQKIWAYDFNTRTRSDYSYSDNYKDEGEWVEQTSKPHRWCTTPRWEKIQDWQFIQAFKHENWFSDAPCEAQIRLCTMWELLWTYTESTCKTRDTSFIDRINGSPTRKTYSKEKVERIKKQIKNEEIYYKNARKEYVKSTNSDALDRILRILDED